jgi:hypothetical protein
MTTTLTIVIWATAGASKSFSITDKSMPSNKKGGKNRRAATRQSLSAASNVDGEVQSDAARVDGAVRCQGYSNEWLAGKPNTAVDNRNDNEDGVTVSVDDEVQIKGLVSAPQFNGMSGWVISDVDPTTTGAV